MHVSEIDATSERRSLCCSTHDKKHNSFELLSLGCQLCSACVQVSEMMTASLFGSFFEPFTVE